MNLIKTRFAPSPTGIPHIGNIRSAIFPYVFAAKNKGQLLLRIDDTDTERSKQEYIDYIFEDIEWLNIKYDYTFKQSERKDLYNSVFQDLLKKGYVYECFETPEELEDIKIKKRLQKKAPIFEKKDRIYTSGKNPYYRIELPEGNFQLNDLVFKNIKSKKEWSDPIIKKPAGDYPYIFTSVVDDIQENITHIIRGADHVSNTFVQQQIGSLILEHSWNVVFAHFPMYLDKDGSKLSKRNASTSLKTIREELDVEYISVWSYLLFLGQSQKQIFSYDEQDYIDAFSLDKYSKSPQMFDFDVLLNTNRKILMKIPDDVIEKTGLDLNLWNTIKFNINTLTEYSKWQEFVENFNWNFKFNICNTEISGENLKEYFIKHNKDGIVKYSEENNLNKFELSQELRKKLTGEENGPPINELLYLSLQN